MRLTPVSLCALPRFLHYQTFEPEEALRLSNRFEFHYTPKHGSWLNMAEIELGVLSRQCLNRRVPDKATLEREVKAWQNDRNEKVVKVNWRFTQRTLGSS